MGEFNLENITSFSENSTVLTKLCYSEKVCVNLLCMEEGQTALEDTNDQKVVVIINTGSGSVVTGEGEQDVEEGTLIVFESGESRSIKAKTKLTALVTAIPKG
jgi:quercetin dioxygenase-like cupin family protein|tara:strand:+ start:408 stop:716 length:309 start_codon:yes stop_codon:yes gene_type:complete